MTAPSLLFGSAAPWADPSLKIQEGLDLWVDAGRQPAAWSAQSKPTLFSGDAVDVVFDASGHERHLLQRQKSAQPRLVQAGELGVLRFDGIDDYLGLTGQQMALEDMTLFIVAAPAANPGFFRALLSFNATGKNDYTTGFNLDQGPTATDAFEVLSPEGPGFGGAMDLCRFSFPFSETHLIETRVARTDRTVSVWVDGQAAGQRPFNPHPLQWNDLSLGARFYSNTGEPPFVSGFFGGHIAELLLYGRTLSPDETTQVRNYLKTKYRPLDAALTQTTPGHRLEPLNNPPPLQVLVPGFTVKELPVSLNNLNVVRYREDGKLVALGYNGLIHVLSDTDGDGLEDKDQIFWDGKSTPTPIGMALTPPGYPRGRGIFVATMGKLSLILDTDGDDRGDQEIVVATGWPMPRAPGGGVVEILGVAVDRDGSLYFGLGTDDFSNAYLIDKTTGQAAYRLSDDRGTIQKVSPDFSRRETVCTGIRFPVGMAFNQAGDLFCTDQEGATWLPNGNPFDELLHILPGRHYGFPPGHPRHLPNVIDEPSVYDYGPQHQSTCGLYFNESVNGGPVFGPAWWQGDALVAGESRGKLYRTQLVKTPAGYVARNHILACLNLLTVDACVSPQGELVVSTHGGQPDWGSGPNGRGRLFKVFYQNHDQPQPVHVWAQTARQIRVAFDRPLDPIRLAGLKAGTRITYGKHVRAGDEFETMRPGYEVVRRQMNDWRFDLPILDAQVTPDRRTLVFTTPAQTAALSYGLTLPGLGRPTQPTTGEIPQLPRIDLDYDLSGVETKWQPADEAVHWTGWLPHLDLQVSRSFTRGSVEHDNLWTHLESPGTLTLTCQLDLREMLQPAIQPGARLDYDRPTETVFLTLRAGSKLTVQSPSDSPAIPHRLSDSETMLEITPGPKGWIPLTLELTTGPGTTLQVSWHTKTDPRARALPLRRLLVPWATEETAPSETPAVPEVAPELAGGNWGKGRQVFFSDQALCSQCHTIHGQGGHIGPDLSNLIYRDYASVLKDIQDPSAALNPDHLAYEITLTDGESLIGTLRQTDADHLLVGEGPGLETPLARNRIQSMRALEMSIMPPGLDQLLGAEEMKDLLSFLLLPPPRLKDYGPLPPPPPRSHGEVATVLNGAPPPPEEWAPRHIVLVAGPKDHGPGEHDYPAWQAAWSQWLTAANNVTISTAWEWPSAAQLAEADALVFFLHGNYDPQRLADLDAFLARGGGATFIHWAVDGGKDPEGCAQRLGLAWKGGQSKFRHGQLDLEFNPNLTTAHPVLRNFTPIHLHDETYWQLAGDTGALSVLATAEEDGKPQPILWTKEQGRGRVFGSILGHYAWTFDDPLVRILLLRGIAWSMHEPVDRFNELVTLGAAVK